MNSIKEQPREVLIVSLKTVFGENSNGNTFPREESQALQAMQGRIKSAPTSD